MVTFLTAELFMLTIVIGIVIVIIVILSEVLSPEGRSIKANPQAERFFNPDSQAAWQRSSCDWALAHRSTVGDGDNIKMMSRNISGCLSLAYPSACIGSCAGAKHSLIPRNSPLRTC